MTRLTKERKYSLLTFFIIGCFLVVFGTLAIITWMERKLGGRRLLKSEGGLMKKIVIYIIMGAFVLGTAAALTWLANVARAENPCGFEKVKEICTNAGEIFPGVNGIEISMPDSNRENEKGTIFLSAGDGPKGTGVLIGVKTEEGDFLACFAVYYLSDTQTFLCANLMTGEKTTCTQETACKFVETWFTLYEKSKGLPI